MTSLDRSTLLDALTGEIGRFVEVLGAADVDDRVPTCPDWDIEHLTVHTGMIHRWVAQVVSTGTTERLPKPELVVGDDLPDWFADGGSEVLAALTAAKPDEVHWNWAGAPDSLAFWMRRMVHETLVHRLDLEIAAGVPIASADDDVVADGIDELFDWFAGGVPDWGTFASDGVIVALASVDGAHQWRLELGRCHGTHRDEEVDLAAFLVVDPASEAATTLTAPLGVLHRWVWGRGNLVDAPNAHVAGDQAHLHTLRATIADAT